jgi:hypothetical protein
LSSTFNVDPSLSNDPRRVLPIAAHPARVTEDGALTNLLVLKQRGSHGGTISFTAHFICYHPSYAHSFAAFVTTNVLTAQTRVTYPEGFCYVITSGLVSVQKEESEALRVAYSLLSISQ